MPKNTQNTAPLIEVSLSPEGFREMAAQRYGEKAGQIIRAVEDAEMKLQASMEFDRLMDLYNNKEYALRILDEMFPRSKKTIERWVYPRGWYRK